jgi:phosphate transport system protein
MPDTNATGSPLTMVDSEFTPSVPEPPRSVRGTFAEHLDGASTDLVRLAAMTAEAIRTASHALLAGDLGAAERVIEENSGIDALKEDLEFRVYEIFALQQPMARDLRTLIAMLRILHEIQLTAGLTVSIAKAARRLYPAELNPKVRGILEQMGTQGSIQLNVAVDAFADHDLAIASALPDMDDVMDDLQRDFFRVIFDTCPRDESGLHQAVQLALLGRFYERIADHAVLIGAWTRFMITGEFPTRAEESDTAPEV